LEIVQSIDERIGGKEEIANIEEGTPEETEE
jgi:hypothetical protein